MLTKNPVLLLSLITFKLREEVFSSWVNFAVWAVPILIILPHLSSDRGSSLFLSFREILDVAQKTAEQMAENLKTILES